MRTPSYVLLALVALVATPHVACDGSGSTQDSAPTLDVIQDGSDITPPSTSALTADPSSVRFDVAGGNATSTLTLRAGAGRIAVTDVRLSPTVEWASVERQGLPWQFEPGETREITITYAGSGESGDTTTIALQGLTEADTFTLNIPVSLTGDRPLPPLADLVAEPGTVVFPSTGVGAVSTEVVRLRNTTDESMEVMSAEIEGDRGLELDNLSSLLPALLRAGSDPVELEIRCSPLNSDPMEGDLVVLYRMVDDPQDIDVLRVPLRCNVGSPCAELVTSAGDGSIDFGEVRAGQSATSSFAVRHCGDPGSPVLQIDALDFATSPPGAGDPGGFSLAESTSLPVRINQGDQRSLRVRFAPDIEGSWSGTLTLTTNDPSAPQVLLNLAGTATEGVVVDPPDATPDTTPDTSPDTTPDTSLDTTPDTSPDTTPDTSPDTTPSPTVQARARCRIGRDGSYQTSLTVAPFALVECETSQSSAPAGATIDSVRWELHSNSFDRRRRMRQSTRELSLTVPEPGNYQLRVWVTDSEGRESAQPALVNISSRMESDLLVTLTWSHAGNHSADPAGRSSQGCGGDLDIFVAHTPTFRFDVDTETLSWRRRDATTPSGMALNLSQDIVQGVGPEAVTIHNLSEGDEFVVGAHYYAARTFGWADARVRVYRNNEVVFSIAERLETTNAFWSAIRVRWENDAPVYLTEDTGVWTRFCDNPLTSNSCNVVGSTGGTPGGNCDPLP